MKKSACKRDRIIQTIAKIIVWFEDLRYAINDARFISAIKKLETQALPKPPYKRVTKVINDENYVVATFKEFR